MIRWILLATFLASPAYAQLPSTYVGGDMDEVTPQVQILQKRNFFFVRRSQETVPVRVYRQR